MRTILGARRDSWTDVANLRSARVSMAIQKPRVELSAPGAICGRNQSRGDGECESPEYRGRCQRPSVHEKHPIIVGKTSEFQRRSPRKSEEWAWGMGFVIPFSEISDFFWNFKLEMVQFDVKSQLKFLAWISASKEQTKSRKHKQCI